MPANFNLYELLGVDEKASQEEIKLSYRKLAMKYHPDTNPDPDAKQQFQVINTAYRTLKDPFKRKVYDLSRKGGAILSVRKTGPASGPAAADQMTQEEIRRAYWNSPAGQRKRKEYEDANKWVNLLSKILLFLSIPIALLVIYDLFFPFRQFDNDPDRAKPLSYMVLGLVSILWISKSKKEATGAMGFFLIILFIAFLSITF